MGRRTCSGTHGPDRAAVVVEFQAGVLERQAAIVEQPPDFLLRILHQVLVDDAVDAAGQGGVEVIQQLDIVAIIAPEIGEVVGERLPLVEMLLERREAGAERVAAGRR